MAPETLRRGSRRGFGVDIYSLGFLAYQSLLGLPEFKRLYGATKPREWVRWMLSREPFKTLQELGAAVSPGISAVVKKMIEKDAGGRYQTTDQVRAELDSLAPPSHAAAPNGLQASFSRVKLLLRGSASKTAGTSAAPAGSAGAGLATPSPSEPSGSG
jgi:serine/threonine protein kinase